MRNFSARETEWLLELDGIELASFWQRAAAFVVDWVIVAIVLSALVTAVAASVYTYMQRHGRSMEEITRRLPVTANEEGEKKADVEIHIGPKGEKTYRIDEHSKTGKAISEVVEILVPVLYFGVLLWWGKGRTPGKRLMRIRVVSIVHRHLTFWHSVERALGYGAAALEGGFGFVQFFIHPYRRCAQDRLAETLVVTERGYKQMQAKREHALKPDTDANEGAAE